MTGRITSFVAALAFAALVIPGVACATFIPVDNPSGLTELDLYLDQAHDTSLFTGHVGSQNGPIVNIQANTVIPTIGSGQATIQDTNGDLQSLIFTPVNHYGDFLFRAQLENDGYIRVTVQSNTGTQSFDFETQKSKLTDSIGVLSIDTQYIVSVTIAALDENLGTDNTFNQVKQIDFSPANESAPVPEPGTMMMLGAGFLGLGIFLKRRRAA